MPAFKITPSQQKKILDKLHADKGDFNGTYDLLVYAKRDYVEKNFELYLPVNPKRLGSGTKGVAYETMEHDKVLKLTVDKSEANASKLLVGKSPKTINDIYASFLVKETSVYGIYQKRLKPITNSEMVDIFYWVVGSCKPAIDGPVPLKEIPNIISDVKESSDDSDRNWSLKDISKITSWYIECRLELRKFGIHDYNDFSMTDEGKGNIMLDENNNFKLIDLGYSKSKVAKIDLVENMNINRLLNIVLQGGPTNENTN